MANWKIFYAGGQMFSSEHGTCKTAPARGVQIIVQDHPDVGAEIVTGADYYVWEGRWRGVDIFGLFDYLIESGLVKFGRTITQDEYNLLMRNANMEKAAWLPGERKTT